jgi:protein-tyrosine-phosphatase
MKFLFVCTANCSRSAMSEAYFKHLLKQNKLSQLITCESAGIRVSDDCSVPDEAQELMQSLGLTLEHHVPKQIDIALVKQADHIICLTREHQKYIADNFPEDSKIEGKVRLLLSFTGQEDDVDDPHTGDLETFQLCFLSMMPALASLTDRLMRSV